MSTDSRDRFVYRESSSSIVIGAALLAGGLIFYWLNRRELIFELGTGAFVITGAVMMLLSSNFTLIADRSTHILHLQYSFPLFRRTREIPFDEIADIQAQLSRGSSSRGYSRRVYRLVAVLKDGKVVPFRAFFTSDARKTQTAKRLRLFITGKEHSDVPKVTAPLGTLTV